MRTFGRNNVVPVNNRLLGGPGAALYLGPPGVDDPKQIRYRNTRLLNRHAFVVINDDWQPGGGVNGDPFIRETAVAVVKDPTNQFSVTLDAAYTSVTFWCQVRTHEGGIENETIWRPIRVSVDGSQDSSDSVDGTAVIVAVQKLDGGGMRVQWLYLAATTGVQPTSFTLTPTAGPTTPADVAVSYRASVLDYSADVTGLTDAGAYTFELQATDGAAVTTLATINFTADADGGGAVQSLTAQEC